MLFGRIEQAELYVRIFQIHNFFKSEFTEKNHFSFYSTEVGNNSQLQIIERIKYDYESECS